MGSGPPHVIRLALVAQLAGHCERQFRTAKDLLTDQLALAPDETENSTYDCRLESTMRRKDSFLSAYMPGFSFSIFFVAGSGCIPSPSFAYLVNCFVHRISGRNSARHRTTIRSVTPYSAINSSNDGVATTRRVAQIATFLHAGKIVARNFPSVRKCKLAFSARALASAAPIANLAFCSRHDRPQPRECQRGRRAIETTLPAFGSQ